MKLTEVYDRNSAYWDSKLYRGVYYAPYVRLFRKLQRDGWLSQPTRILDCGIGAGLLSDALLAVTGLSLKLNGVDLSGGVLGMAAAKFRARGVQAQLAFSDVCRLPYRNGQMDLVMGALVLEHISRPVDAVCEMTRVLRHRSPLVLVATRRWAPDHYFRWKYHYSPYRAVDVMRWMTAAGLTEVRPCPLSGLGRFFARAYIGKKP